MTLEDATTPKEYIIFRMKQLLEDLEPREHEKELVDLILKMLSESTDKDEWLYKLIEKIRVLVVRDSCILCGAQENLVPTRVIARNRGGPMLPINLIMLCTTCDEQRGEKGLYEWWVIEQKQALPPRLEIQYLTILYLMHHTARTLDRTFDELHLYCDRCKHFLKHKKCEGASMLLCLEEMVEVVLHE